MVKNVLNRDLLREIRRTKNRFISIVLLVVIAVAFLYGLRISAPDMQASMDSYLDAQNLMDAHIMSTLGLTDEDVAAVAAVEGAAAAEGGYTVDAVASNGADSTMVVKALSITEKDINTPVLIEGRLPRKADECLIEDKLGTNIGVAVGDTLFLDTGEEAYKDALRSTEFTIVGVCKSPLYTSVSRGTSTLGNGSVGAFVLLSPAAYTLDYFTDIYVLAAAAKPLDAYGTAYEDLSAALTAQLESIQAQREKVRTAQVKGDAEAELADGRRDYEDAAAKAYEALDAAWAELQQAAAELNGGWDAYYDGAARLEQGKTLLAEGEAELDSSKTRLEQGETAYADGVTDYEVAETAYADGKKQYDEGYARYQAGVAAYETGDAAYQSSLNAYETESETYQQELAALDGAFAQWQAEADALAAERQQLLDSGLDETTVNDMLAAREAALNGKKAVLDEQKADLDAKGAYLNGMKAQLDAAKGELDANKATLTETGAVLAGEKTVLDAGRAQLDQSKELLNGNRATLDSGWEQYHNGVSALYAEQEKITLNALTLEEAYRGLADGQTRYDSGLADYNSGKAAAEKELADAEAGLNDAQAEIDDIEPAEWYVLDRDTNMGFAGYRQDAERMDKLAAVFPLVFFLVAALVCLTGMTRMVEEQRVQIGALKAMGYSKGAISRKYVGYGFAASLTGSILGLIIGATVLPWVIVDCWKVMYDYPGVTLTFDFGLALGCVALAVVCCSLAVLGAVFAALREAPATLMRPKAPKAGKHIFLERIPFFWKHLSFDRKVAFRNLFRYKKRFWMTVIGIAGCTGLLLTGFGLYNSIMDIIDLQYKNVSTYGAVLYADENVTDAQWQGIRTALAEEPELSAYAPCYLNTVTLESPAYQIDGNLLVVDDPDALSGFWDFHDRKTKKPVPMTDDGAILSEKTASLLGVEAGDTITVVFNEKHRKMVISGIMENYVGHYIFVTQNYCEAALGVRPEHTQVLLSYDESGDWEAMGSRLLATDGVTGIFYQKESREIVKNQLNGVYPAVVIIIIAAAALAFVVLFNLSSINLTERKRELATLRVLGLRDQEMRDYVFRENLILTLLGIALGLVFGNLFHAFLMETIEVDLVMFGRQIHPLSYLFAIGLTLLFTVIVNVASGRSLAKIDMVESLKSVE